MLPKAIEFFIFCIEKYKSYDILYFKALPFYDMIKMTKARSAFKQK